MKKYLSLYNETKKNILNGVYKTNEKLPSKRVMADRSGLSLITVEKAYSMLEEEGYIFASQRKGYFVNPIDAVFVKKSKSENIHFEYLEEPKNENKCDFEYSVWFKTVRKVISDRGNELFIKSPSKGCAVLRNALSDYLLRYRGMAAPPQSIIIGSGSEQLYEFVVRLLGNNKVYGIENPSFEYISSVYSQMGAKICPLDLGDDGIKSGELTKKFDVLHITPFHSYPTGITAPIKKRQEYLKIAKERGIYIVEDDFDSEFFIPGQPVETLYSMDNSDRVIYINTFSKSLSPSMRMGYMILPKKLVEEYDKKLEHFSCSVPVMDQYILAEFISSGNFERHLSRIRRKMK